MFNRISGQKILEFQSNSNAILVLQSNLKQKPVLFFYYFPGCYNLHWENKIVNPKCHIILIGSILQALRLPSQAVVARPVHCTDSIFSQCVGWKARVFAMTRGATSPGTVCTWVMPLTNRSPTAGSAARTATHQFCSEAPSLLTHEQTSGELHVCDHVLCTFFCENILCIKKYKTILKYAVFWCCLICLIRAMYTYASRCGPTHN